MNTHMHTTHTSQASPHTILITRAELHMLPKILYKSIPGSSSLGYLMHLADIFD